MLNYFDWGNPTVNSDAANFGLIQAQAYSLETILTDMRMWTDTDRETQRVVAYHGHINMQEQEVTIWMDGRPHPPANALHTWSGFSTGEWDGDELVVTTTP